MNAPSSSSPVADVIVPVYGGWEHVEDCIASLLVQTAPCRIIVVDDASPDDTAARIRQTYPALEILQNEINRGFAASCNRGIRVGDAPVAILVNSDIVARPDMVASIVARFRGPDVERVGSIAPVLLDGEGRVDSFGIAADPTLAGFVRYHGAQPDSVDAHQPELLGPYGAVAAYRRKALDEVGLLDENIFMYGEELDLALRLQAAGWGAAPLEHIVGSHSGGASAGYGSPRQRYLSGFGRGYLLRVYGILGTRHSARAIATEVLASAVGAIRDRDLAAIRGRLAGWHRGKDVPRRAIPGMGVDRRIDLRTSLAMRRQGYWARAFRGLAPDDGQRVG